MLMKVLRLISGGITNKEEIMGRLGVEESVLDGYLERLERMGYLSSGDRVKGCKGCPYSKSCGGGCVSGTRMLFVTDKGRKALEGAGN